MARRRPRPLHRQPRPEPKRLRRALLHSAQAQRPFWPRHDLPHHPPRREYRHRQPPRQWWEAPLCRRPRRGCASRPHWPRTSTRGSSTNRSRGPGPPGRARDTRRRRTPAPPGRVRDTVEMRHRPPPLHHPHHQSPLGPLATPPTSRCIRTRPSTSESWRNGLTFHPIGSPPSTGRASSPGAPLGRRSPSRQMLSPRQDCHPHQWVPVMRDCKHY